jgi:Na+-transporting NADH:ubiquinone oxidoreductase subunit C
MKSILFAGIMCIGASVILSGAASGLKSRQEVNIELDMKKNILQALALPTDGDIRATYNKSVKELVITTEGDIVEGKKPADLTKDDPSNMALYTKIDEQGKTLAYCLPVEGKGLWSTIKGYLALESDLNTVLGITFYSQGETAGLGAEIAAPWFLNNWKGKKILGSDGSLKSITIVKGQVNPNSSDAIHQVDGISGATMTDNGVNVFIKKDLLRYNTFFNKERAK